MAGLAAAGAAAEAGRLAAEPGASKAAGAAAAGHAGASTAAGTGIADHAGAGARVADAGSTAEGGGGAAGAAAGAGTGVAAGTGPAVAGTGRGDGAAGTGTTTPDRKAGPGRKKAGRGKTGPAREKKARGKTGPGRDASTGPGRDSKTGPGQGRKTTPGQGRAGGAWRGRRGIVLAVAVVVLVAGALAGIGIARSGGGPAQPEFTLVTPIPPVTAADAALAGPAAGATTLQASLTGIAAAGKTVVAIGAAPSQPGPLPLFLLSTDGGHTWSRAALAGPGPGGASGTSTGASAAAPPGGPAGPGLTTGPAPAVPGTAAGPGAATAPGLIARSGGTWLALGQHTAWTSPDGRIWQQAPGLPTVPGDTVLGLAATGSGFLAVGQNTGTEPGPVVWTWPAGRAWERSSGPGLGLTAHGGHATALRWAAGQNGVVVAGGPVSGAAGQGRRPEASLWRSTNGGVTWKPVTLPGGHGATAGLAGLAAGGTGFVAVRPGRAAGRQDAVTYQSAQGSRWRYAGKLTPLRRTSLQVTTVSGGSHGFVVAATIHASQVAFFSARGRGWQRIPDPGTGVAGLTAGPGGTVVVAGNGQSGTGAAGMRPHLLLTGPGTGRQQVGQAVLAAGATPDATVNGLATGGHTLVAAGASGGSPALWLASAGRWAPADVLLPGAWRSGALTSVVHGAQGWLAIGQAAAPAAAAPARQQPVILTSATGTSWTPAFGQSPLAAPGASLVQAAAGQGGYVVVGSAAVPGSAATAPAPVAWYSKNLSTWARAPLASDGYSPAGAAGSHRVLAVTAAGPGFVAVGSAGTVPAAWTSRNGSAWRFSAVPLPAGTAGAALTNVTAAGGRVLAAGYAWRAGQAPASGRPFTAVSADGGRTWRDSVLPAPPRPTVVTALTTAGHGFVVAGRAGRVTVGQAGQQAGQVMLVWWSADGLTWRDGVPAGGGPGRAFVPQLNAVTAGDGTLTGAGFAASTAAEHPVLWHARYR